jgi:hypothetical protein
MALNPHDDGFVVTVSVAQMTRCQLPELLFRKMTAQTAKVATEAQADTNA